MMSLRTIAIALSLMIHASVGYAMFVSHEPPSEAAFDAGTGSDSIFVEQGIAIEGLAKLGDAAQTIETVDIPPITEAAPPVQEVKPEELNDAITSTESKVEDNIVKAEEPPPTPVPPAPEAVAVKEQQQQVAMVTEQSSGEARTGSLSTTARTKYLGKLRDVLEKSKINPRSRLAGIVWVKFKVGPSGDLLSREITASSGSKVLDDAAVAALDRAAPFPPMPNEVADEPMVVSVPFKFITR